MTDPYAEIREALLSLRANAGSNDYADSALARLDELEAEHTRLREALERSTSDYVYVISFDQDEFGIFHTREAAEADLERQIALGGPAWDACKVVQRLVKGEARDEAVVVHVEWTREKIAGYLNCLPFVRWDCFVEAPLADSDHRVIGVYGWIDRDDGLYDFVRLGFASWSPDPGASTSSAEHSREIMEILYGPGRPHHDCQRVEDGFGALVERKVVLDRG